MLRIPNYDPVVFENAPLEEVVCQLRFNQILRIAAEPPAQFQDRIRGEFPVLEREQGIQLALSMPQPILRTDEPALQFKSTDGAWVVSLTTNFLALKTIAYTHFDDFLRRLNPVVGAFEDIYSPSAYVRVGLRYINRLIKLKQDGRVPWEQVLNPHLASLRTDPSIRDSVAEAKHYLVLRHDIGQIGWRYSWDEGQSDGRPAERFTLDFDHYATGPIPSNRIAPLLTDFNDTAYRLFRWCLTEAGTAELNPIPREE